MKKKRIIEIKSKDLKPGRTNWERLHNMTEEEIMEAALADPDAQPSTERSRATGKMVTAEQLKEGRKHLPGRPQSDGARFEMRMDPELKQWADSYAASIGIKTSGLVRMLLLKEKGKVELEK